jgi:purine-nucleoside phosphorylase
MSTVLEAIQARALGLEVAGFSYLTNWAAGMGDGKVSHAEVLNAGRHAAHAFNPLLEAAL